MVPLGLLTQHTEGIFGKRLACCTILQLPHRRLQLVSKTLHCLLCCICMHYLPQLAFFESNQLARAALYYYLRRLGLAVEVKTSLVYAQDCLLSNNITSNTAADWVDRGMNLLQQQVGSGAGLAHGVQGGMRCVGMLVGRTGSLHVQACCAALVDLSCVGSLAFTTRFAGSAASPAHPSLVAAGVCC